MKKIFSFLLGILLLASVSFAADLLQFPPDCDTPGERLEYSYRAQELLRYENNVMSYWLNCGLTQDEYDNGLIADRCDKTGFCCGVDELTILGSKLKTEFPYQPYITVADYMYYFNTWFKQRQSRVGSECVKNREACAQDQYCSSEYMTIVEGLDGLEVVPDKDFFKVSSKYPIIVQDIER